MYIDKSICFAGEISLPGEIRPVSRIEQRITEARKIGFKTIFISRYHTKSLDLKKMKDIEVAPVGRVEELAGRLF